MDLTFVESVFVRSWHFMMANCVNMRACIFVFLSSKSQPFHVFLPLCSVLFCFMIHSGPLSWASFYLSISAFCAVSSHNKSYFTNVWLMLNKYFFIKAASAEWQNDTKDHYTINSLYWTLYRIQLKPYTFYLFSCLYSEFSLKEATCSFCTTTSKCQII